MDLPFDLEVKYTVEPPSSINREGKVKILDFLMCQGLPILPEDFDWAVVSKEGRITKRIAKHYFKADKTKIDPAVITQVGNMVDMFAMKVQRYTIDFTDDFNWNAGDFGDSDSCFWGGRSVAREMLKRAGCIAIRIFEPARLGNGFKGVGRAWMAPHKPEQNNWLIWNAYGPHDLRKIARIFACFINAGAGVRISLRNFGDSTDTFYINNGTGMLIGPAVTKYMDYDFKLVAPKPKCHCYSCEEPLWYDEEIYMLGEDAFCLGCYEEQSMVCDNCHELMSESQSAIVMTESHSYESWCPACVTNTFYCGECSEYRPVSMMTDVEGVCSDCEEHLETCDQCSNRMLSRYLYRVVDKAGDFMKICYSCFGSASHVFCEFCGATMSVANSHQHKADPTNRYCGKCIKDLRCCVRCNSIYRALDGERHRKICAGCRVIRRCKRCETQFRVMYESETRRYCWGCFHTLNTTQD